jgi:hypothetical protein
LAVKLSSALQAIFLGRFGRWLVHGPRQRRGPRAQRRKALSYSFINCLPIARLWATQDEPFRLDVFVYCGC